MVKIEKTDEKSKIGKVTIIIGMGVIILVLLSVILVPKIVEPFKNKYREEGCETCLDQVLAQMVNDLQNQGYTLIPVGNQTMALTAVG